MVCSDRKVERIFLNENLLQEVIDGWMRNQLSRKVRMVILVTGKRNCLEEKNLKKKLILGMRDKKDVSDVMSNEKRVPNSGFFGMRGKKAPLVTITINDLFGFQINFFLFYSLELDYWFFRHKRQKRSI